MPQRYRFIARIRVCYSGRRGFKCLTAGVKYPEPCGWAGMTADSLSQYWERFYQQILDQGHGEGFLLNQLLAHKTALWLIMLMPTEPPALFFPLQKSLSPELTRCHRFYAPNLPSGMHVCVPRGPRDALVSQRLTGSTAKHTVPLKSYSTHHRLFTGFHSQA